MRSVSCSDLVLRYFVMIGATLCGLPQQTAADPSDCEERLHHVGWTQKYAESADLVFLGKVVAEEMQGLLPREEGKLPETNSVTELLESIEIRQSRRPRSDPVQQATFKIAKSWKGRVPLTIDVKASPYTDDTAYHAPLRQGDTYLVFAYRDANDGALHIPVGCAFPYSFPETELKITVLDAVARRPDTG